MSFVRNHTTGTSASGTSVTATLAADVAAGNLLAVWAAMDNTGTTTPTVSSIDKPGGESATWARVASHDASSATSAAAVRGELWVIKTTVAWTSGTVITATLSASPPKSHLLCQEHNGVLATLRGTSGTGTSTAGTPSAATSGTALQAGDLVLGGATGETSATPSGDTDTTNGSWSTALTGNTGGGASATQVSSILQYKYVTAAGVQTYNPVSVGTVDSGAAVAGLQFDPNKTLTDSGAAADTIQLPETGGPTRQFAAASFHFITTTAGTAGTLAQGARTLAALVRVTTAAATNRALVFAGRDSGTLNQTGLAIGNTGDGELLALQDATGGFVFFTGRAITVTDGWVLIAVTKAAGASTPRAHEYNFGTQTWVHSDAATTVADLATTVADFVIGDSFTGRIAVAGAVTAALSDVAVETLAGGVQDWLDNLTTVGWRFDQATVTAISDYTGGGADQNGVNGTTVSGDGPAGFDWTLGGATPITLTDSGAATDQVQVAVGAPLAEVGTGSDTLQVAAAVPLADSGTAADLVQVTVPRALNETAAAADSLAAAAATALADQGLVGDQVQLSVVVPLNDQAAGADTLTVVQGVTPKTLADSGTGADSLRPAATVPLADAGLAADALAVRQPTWLVDTFQQFGTAESWADATTHGQWFVQFGGVAAGNGVGTETDTGSTVLFEKPDVATDPDPGDETHAGLVTSTAQFGANLDFAADVKTVQQLRQNLAPNPWEVAWLVWAYTDNNHFYYFALKSNGIELGKRHPAYAGGQRFLWTAATPTLTLNTWNRIRVVQDANVLSVFVDGTELTLGTGGPNGKSFVDVGGVQADAPYLTGAVGLYNEDAWVRFDNVQANAAVPADSGAAADVAQVAAQIPLADAGVGADSLTVNQGATPKTLADTGTGADTARVAATVPLAEGGVGADSLSVPATGAATVEVGAIRWVAADVGTPKTLADSGAGTDTLRVAAAAVIADQATGTDTLRPAATVPLADSATATTDLLQLAAQLPLADQAVAADQAQVAATATLTEQGTASDTAAAAAQVPLAQQGTAADSMAVGQFEPKALPDSGTAADTLQVTAAALLADLGAAADQLQAVAAVLLADSGAAADTLQVNQGIPKTLADSGTASDQPQAAAQVPLPESGQATDTLVADQTRTLTDSGTAADSLTVGQFVPKPVNDSGTGADQLLAVAQVPLAESGTAAETLLPIVTAPLAETGAAADTLVVQQLGDTKALADSGAGADTLAVTQARLLTDSGTGSDQLVVIQGRVLTDQGTGADTLRPSALLVLADGATANDLLALAALAALGDHGTGQDALVVLTVARWIRTQSTERPTMTSSREPATATSSREPVLATSSREQGGP